MMVDLMRNLLPELVRSWFRGGQVSRVGMPENSVRQDYLEGLEEERPI